MDVYACHKQMLAPRYNRFPNKKISLCFSKNGLTRQDYSRHKANHRRLLKTSRCIPYKAKFLACRCTHGRSNPLSVQVFKLGMYKTIVETFFNTRIFASTRARDREASFVSAKPRHNLMLLDELKRKQPHLNYTTSQYRFSPVN